MAKNRLPIDMSDLQLTVLEIKFIGEYCTSNFDEVKSYKKVYGSRTSDLSEPEIRLAAFEVLNKRDVKVAVQRFVDSVLGPAADKLDLQLLQILRKRAMYDVKDFFNRDGSVKRLDEISDADRMVIDSVEQDLKGKNADAVLTKFKLANRDTALKQLIDLLKKKEEITDEGLSNVTETQRVQIRDIFNSIDVTPNLSKGIIHDHNMVIDIPVQIDSDEEDVKEDESELVSVQPKADPAIVQKAKQIATKENFGFPDTTNPLVQAAMALAERTKK